MCPCVLAKLNRVGAAQTICFSLRLSHQKKTLSLREDAIAEFGHVAVVGFEDVTCAETIKVVEAGQAKALTTVTTNPENYKKADGTVESGVSSFETVVTPDYYTGVIAPNEASVTCSGTVELSFTDPTPKYTKMGCISVSDSLYQEIEFDNYTVGTEDEVKRCNDRCSGSNYFILGCPYWGNLFTCLCVDNGVEVSSETCSASKPGNAKEHCYFSKIENSAYEFGLGNLDLKYPAYKVTTRRRLTASFSTNSGDLLQRHLQESGNQADTSGSFGTEVLLSREDNNAVFGDLAAPAADTGAVPSTVMASAAGALVVAAAAALA